MLSWQRGDSQRKGTLMDREKTFLSLTLDSRYTQITVNTPLQLQFSVDASRVSDWTDRLYKGLVASICCCRLRKKKKKLCLLFAAFTQDLVQLFNERYALQRHSSVSRDLKRHTDARVVVTFSLRSHHLKKVRSGAASGLRQWWGRPPCRGLLYHRGWRFQPG